MQDILKINYQTFGSLHYKILKNKPKESKLKGLVKIITGKKIKKNIEN